MTQASILMGSCWSWSSGSLLSASVLVVQLHGNVGRLWISPGLSGPNEKVLLSQHERAEFTLWELLSIAALPQG